MRALNGRCSLRTCALVLLLAAYLAPHGQHSHRTVAAAAETPTIGIAEELATLPQEHCQSTWQLRDIAAAAAWTTEVHGVSRAVLGITTCDLHCMRKLFVPWMHSIQNSRDGDFSQHIVVVGNGIPAYTYCDSLRAKFKHHCVLDRMCLPPGAPDMQGEFRTHGMGFGRPLYLFALMQKVTWAMEVMKLGLSVLWLDMDIYFHGSPFKYMSSVPPDADFVVQTEAWDHRHMFRGDVCRYQWKAGPSCDGHTYNPITPSLTPECCGMFINGGMWLVHPTEQGIALMQTWVGVMFEDGIAMGRLWNGTAHLDQTWLFKVVTDPVRSVGLYCWDEQAGRYTHYANVTRDPANTVVYRTSGQRTASLCGGVCGWRGDNVGFEYHTECGAGSTQQGGLCPGPSHDTPAPGSRLVCTKPQKYADRMVSVHMNCNGDINFKRLAMMSWMNATADEAAYDALVRSDANRAVFPDW